MSMHPSRGSLYPSAGRRAEARFREGPSPAEAACVRLVACDGNCFYSNRRRRHEHMRSVAATRTIRRQGEERDCGFRSRDEPRTRGRGGAGGGGRNRRSRTHAEKLLSCTLGRPRRGATIARTDAYMHARAVVAVRWRAGCAGHKNERFLFSMRRERGNRGGGYMRGA